LVRKDSIPQVAGKSVSAVQRLIRTGLIHVERKELPVAGRKPIPIYRRSDLERLIPGVRVAAAPPRREKSDTPVWLVKLPEHLVKEAMEGEPPYPAGKVDRLVAESLADFVARRKAQAFAAAMAAMAADPAIRKECAAIANEFAGTERDGLGRD
jgi:hypothetical protein